MGYFETSTRIPFGRAMTIAERKAKLEYDRINPWLPMCQAEVDGSICELQFTDMVGSFDAGERRFVMLRKERWPSWICLDDLQLAYFQPSGFRRTGKSVKLSELPKLRRAAR